MLLPKSHFIPIFLECDDALRFSVFRKQTFLKKKTSGRVGNRCRQKINSSFVIISKEKRNKTCTKMSDF